MQLELVNLLKYIQNESEERVSETLSSYSCPLNEEIEIFLREKAVSFA
jgi:hypothetical protein